MSVEIVGTGLFPFGRHPTTGLAEMGAHAVRDALAEAEVGRSFDAAFCGTAYGGVATGHRVLGQLGLTGVPIVDVEAGCASGAAALALAAMAIRAGQYGTVLVFGVEKMPKGMIRSSYFEPWREELGLAAAPAFFALRARRLMIDHGITKNQLAAVVVKNRANGVHNPAAMYRSPVSVEEVLASRVVCDPLHLYMLCSPNEGAAAVVLRSGYAGIQLRSAALSSHRPGHVLDESSPLSGLIDAEVDPPTTIAAKDAYERSGLGPEDVDVAEVQDTDAARELLAYEELSLCAKGDIAKFLEESSLPVNRSGGLLSKGEPLGASALAQVVDLTHQLQGRCGPRQVENPRTALAQTIGRGANASVTILTR